MDEEDEYDKGAIDFCINLDLYSGKNTLQVGARSWTFEDNDVQGDGYTDMYLGWRMKF